MSEVTEVGRIMFDGSNAVDVLEFMTGYSDWSVGHCQLYIWAEVNGRRIYVYIGDVVAKYTDDTVRVV